MKKGMLIYDSSTNRFDVLYEEGNSYGGLHCGTAMEALINDEWILCDGVGPLCHVSDGRLAVSQQQIHNGA